MTDNVASYIRFFDMTLCKSEPCKKLLMRDVFLSVFGGVLAGAAFLYPVLSFGIWITFVPLLISTKRKTYIDVYILGLLYGVAAYGIGSVSVLEFFKNIGGGGFLSTIVPSVIFWLYSAQLPAIMILTFRWIEDNSEISSYLSFPICVVFFHSFFPMLFHLPLGVSQAENIVAVQAISITGVYGLDGIIALVNLLIVRFLMHDLSKKSAAIPLLLVVVWFLFGTISPAIWRSSDSNAMNISVGIIQPNQHQQVRGSSDQSELNPLAMTLKVADEGAKLIIWPETRYKRYFDDKAVARAFRDVVRETGSFVVLQDQDYHNTEDGKISNSIAIIDPEGNQVGVHTKGKLMPFGEKKPAFAKLPGLNRIFSSLFAGVHFEHIPGRGARSMNLLIDNVELEVLPLICYEALFPAYTASGFLKENSRRVILVASNNSWFGTSFQPAQHQRASALRAVETRSHMIHVMNNGPSVVWGPNGRKVFSTALGSAGVFSVNLLLADSTPQTIYTQNSFLITSMFFLLFLSLIILSGYQWIRVKFTGQ